ncbi:MAG: glutamate-5-semialdehyde dehydrogenase, partial [bacterium]
MEIVEKGKLAKEAAAQLALTPTKQKNHALELIAAGLKKNSAKILEANSIDLKTGTNLDRLTLNEKRINDMIEGVKLVSRLVDPVGEVLAQWTRPNGLKIKKVRVPLGVIGIIYEARPNVTVDSAVLCLKAGNAVILRGGSDAINSNIELTKIITDAVVATGLHPNTVQLIEEAGRKAAEELMKARDYVDVLIPRGGKNLIQSVIKNSTIPVIETGEGNCHAYVEKTADLKKAVEIVYNAKVSRPSVCNAIETLLIDEAIADQFLPLVKKRLDQAGVELRWDEEAWKTEFLDLILAVKIVSGVGEAIAHIKKYGTKHSETISTRDKKAAKKFQAEVDAAAVYVNASTRFTDGFEFGFGAEIGISTQKLHARGP